MPRPKTSRTKRTPADEAAKHQQLEAFRREAYARLPEIARACIQMAIGSVHLMLRDEFGTGKFERVTDPDQAWKILNDPNKREGTHYSLATKDPSHAHAALVLAYALDQPKKPVEDHTVTVIDDFESKIAARKKRLHAQRAGAQS